MEEQKKQEMGNHSLTSEFVPYELALRMKQVGFDETCVFYVNRFNEGFIYNFQSHPDEFIEWCGCDVIKTPLFQQVFKWFREKYRLHSCIISDNCIKDTYGYHVDFLTKEDKDLYMVEGVAESEVVLGFNTPKEAELACLEKLIEIVEQNKSD
jgi:hypothetical protein